MTASGHRTSLRAHTGVDGPTPSATTPPRSSQSSPQPKPGSSENTNSASRQSGYPPPCGTSWTATCCSASLHNAGSPAATSSRAPPSVPGVLSIARPHEIRSDRFKEVARGSRSQPVTPASRASETACEEPQPRGRRIEVSVVRLRSASRRPCCFDLSSCTDPEVAQRHSSSSPTADLTRLLGCASGGPAARSPRRCQDRARRRGARAPARAPADRRCCGPSPS